VFGKSDADESAGGDGVTGQDDLHRLIGCDDLVSSHDHLAPCLIGGRSASRGCDVVRS
jgi:hypothetical protein